MPDGDNLLNVSQDESPFDSDNNSTLDISASTEVNSISLNQLRDQVTNIESSLEDTQTTVDDFKNELEAVESHLNEMNETLESRELNIHLIPPNTNISRLAIQAQLVVGVFVVTIALGQFFIPDAPFTFMGLALGSSIATNLITNKMYPAEQR